MYKVESEIFKETNFQSVKVECDGKVVSYFKFSYPVQTEEQEQIKPPVEGHVKTDRDGDMLIQRRKPGTIELLHSEATEIRLVGLQVWRGALLLADFIFHKRQEFCNKRIFELGAGVGLTSIAAAIYVNEIVCSDVDIGGILDLIRENVRRNKNLLMGKVEVLEYDFLKPENEYSKILKDKIDECEIVFAADVIYEDTLIDAFIKVLDYIFAREKATRKRKEIYVALEKRYVFTFAELDSVAPMYEYFMTQLNKKPWHIEYIPLDFPQFFEYERCKQLILFKITAQRLL